LRLYKTNRLIVLGNADEEYGAVIALSPIKSTSIMYQRYFTSKAAQYKEYTKNTKIQVIYKNTQ